MCGKIKLEVVGEIININWSPNRRKPLKKPLTPVGSRKWISYHIFQAQTSGEDQPCINVESASLRKQRLCTICSKRLFCVIKRTQHISEPFFQHKTTEENRESNVLILTSRPRDLQVSPLHIPHPTREVKFHAFRPLQFCISFGVN